ncbi:MAG: YeeE/YedE family protein [Undibacterium sp.]|uniref:YeeE/YedE family protein n=1 Tax=Undibacterium sp. TaxID=1914977 RepID=UPI00271EE02B|nr:YeeE/YedE family protein [Undibacterium sp.]MDO8650601.1 YeeE/YedE family protein [Undibacterium sp.]
MTNRINLLVSLFAGLLFGLGLAISGMTYPGKVLNFLDLAGNWDPALLFVLGGAVGVTVIGFRWILRRKAPLFSAHFFLPRAQDIDRKLVVGALIFGIGWGISGYCPGPAIASLASPNWETWVFLPSMLLGVFLHRILTTTKNKDT